jgi:hypothetical protein
MVGWQSRGFYARTECIRRTIVQHLSLLLPQNRLRCRVPKVGL